MYYVYVLHCEDGSLYCGSTSDYKKRIREHFMRLPTAAKYTKSHRVDSVECVWAAADKISAMKLEYRFKKLVRGEKLSLLKDSSNISRFIPELKEYSFVHVSEVKLEDCFK